MNISLVLCQAALPLLSYLLSLLDAAPAQEDQSNVHGRAEGWGNGSPGTFGFSSLWKIPKGLDPSRYQGAPDSATCLACCRQGPSPNGLGTSYTPQILSGGCCIACAVPQTDPLNLRTASRAGKPLNWHQLMEKHSESSIKSRRSQRTGCLAWRPGDDSPMRRQEQCTIAPPIQLACRDIALVTDHAGAWRAAVLTTFFRVHAKKRGSARPSHLPLPCEVVHSFHVLYMEKAGAEATWTATWTSVRRLLRWRVWL